LVRCWRFETGESIKRAKATKDVKHGHHFYLVNAGLLTRDELKRQERETIINALKRTNGKVSGPGGAAELLGMKPSTLASRITTLGINRRTLS
jgi:transcriptional regulator with GAF, ATPase, and Fis domain